MRYINVFETMITMADGSKEYKLIKRAVNIK
jgi:hypothetical protein